MLTLGTIWTQNSWMDLLRYVRYKYLVLMPRLYAASGQDSRESFLPWSGRRSLRSWLPSHLFILALLGLVLGVFFTTVVPGGYALIVTSLFFIAISAASTLSVLLETQALEREILARKEGGVAP